MSMHSPQQQVFGLLTPGLMPPDDAVQARRLAASVPGMAHWAETGPDGRTCRECLHWGSGKRFRREEGQLCPRRCRQFSRLMQGAEGPGVPHGQASCRHFSLRDPAPSIAPRPRKKAEQQVGDGGDE